MAKDPKFYKCYNCGKAYPQHLTRRVRVVESPKDEGGIATFWCLKCIKKNESLADNPTALSDVLKQALNSGKARMA